MKGQEMRTKIRVMTYDTLRDMTDGEVAHDYVASRSSRSEYDDCHKVP